MPATPRLRARQCVRHALRAASGAALIFSAALCVCLLRHLTPLMPFRYCRCHFLIILIRRFAVYVIVLPAAIIDALPYAVARRACAFTLMATRLPRCYYALSLCCHEKKGSDSVAASSARRGSGCASHAMPRAMPLRCFRRRHVYIFHAIFSPLLPSFFFHRHDADCRYCLRRHSNSACCFCFHTLIRASYACIISATRRTLSLPDITFASPPVVADAADCFRRWHIRHTVVADNTPPRCFSIFVISR